MTENETREFLIVLSVLCDDPDDDPRLWPYDDLLAPPEDVKEHQHVRYVTGAEVKRGSRPTIAIGKRHARRA